MSFSTALRLPQVGHSERDCREDISALQPSGSVSDEVLLAGVCQGNREALAFLFSRYAPIVRGVAYRVLKDKSEADDLLQDIFILIQRLCGTFDSSKGSARFWILQMTHRRALCRRRYLTNRHFYKKVDLDDVADRLADPEAGVGRLDQSLDGVFGNGSGEVALAALSENQRLTLLLHLVEGYTFDEIAEKLNQTRGNVKNHYFRGLEKLRKELLGANCRARGSMIKGCVESRGWGVVAKRTP